MKTKSECEQMRADWKSGMSFREIMEKWFPRERLEAFAIIDFGANPEHIAKLSLSTNTEIVSEQCKKLGLRFQG